MLQLRQVDYRIKSQDILKNISFDTIKGELIAVVGANGAGKSTLMKLISQEYLPTQGKIAWKGTPFAKATIKQMAYERAILTQNIHMSQDFPVEEVVLMGRYPHFKHRPGKYDWEVVQKVSEQTGIQPLAKRNYASLSGGEKQRVQLARALAQLHQQTGTTISKLLLLDEPLNNLDIRYQHRCLQLTKGFARNGNVVLLVIHDLNLAALYADKILLLNQGQLEAYGTPKEVLTEQCLNKCYQFSVKVATHPYHHCPVVYFGDFDKVSCQSSIHQPQTII
ncbi:heme ABC transporter ATP-binding protein [uncultured Microscilla sp.]|uniref:heme ABC transporter ATP-binding protein n=1 Tax=uncultured Microscilla sp. TaxID=432653 RepID=UPI0026357060|nr:heme ABC transporter ATP-binding protein [uncultured Microscilla sp.]